MSLNKTWLIIPSQRSNPEEILHTYKRKGGRQAVANNDPTASTIQGDPVLDIDVKVGKNPGPNSAGPGVSSEGDPVVNAEQSNDCSLALDLAVVQNAESGDDFSTTELAR